MIYQEAMEWGSHVLGQAGVAEAKLDAWLLLETVCRINRTFYYSHMKETMTLEQQSEYEIAIRKRAERIPLQYITGEQEFMGLNFKVNSNVLVPRQDTETLVEEALKICQPGMEILDLGTGSGCIVISLMKNAHGMTATGSDISKQALLVAKENARLHEVEIEWVRSNLYENISGRFDLIVSNPPYIPQEDILGLMPEVRDFEPVGALDGGVDGLDFYRQIIAQGMAERDIPLHVFHFDCYWMEAYEWCNFTWDAQTFPDPKGMLKRYHERGLKICVWINPYIGQKSPLFHEGMKAGFLLKKKNGEVWQTDMWQAGMGLVDFTNPEAVSWYRGKLKALLDMGVDCFKTDFGERIPVKDIAYFDGSDPVKMHNYYPYLYNKTVFDLLEEERGKGEAVLFARSATAGCQQFPAHWGGDCSASYPSMAETLRGGLSLACAGFGFWSHDIGGKRNG